MKLLNVFGLAVVLSCCASVATKENVYKSRGTADTIMGNNGRICSSDIKVIDGDTIELAGKRIRLMCVDTPESYYQSKTQYCLDNETDCGMLAKKALDAIIAQETRGGELCCAWTKKDRYGRYLGWCDNGTEKNIPFSKSINQELVVGGYAWFYDGGKECGAFRDIFWNAKKGGQGLFDGALGGFKEPRLWRKTKSND